MMFCLKDDSLNGEDDESNNFKGVGDVISFSECVFEFIRSFNVFMEKVICYDKIYYCFNLIFFYCFSYEVWCNY